MKKIVLAICCLMITHALSLHAQLVSNDNEDEVNKLSNQFTRNAYRKGEILVKFKANSTVNVKRRINGKFATSSVKKVDAVLNNLGVEEIEELMPNIGKKRAASKRLKVKDEKMMQMGAKDLSKLYRLRVSYGKDTENAIKELQELDDVEFAEPNYLVFTMATPEEYQTDPLFSTQWGISAINLPQLWTVPVLNENRPIIAILDTGVDITHPDLIDNIWINTKEEDGEEGYDNDNNGYKNDVHGWDFINKTSIINDYNGHGTHCAGIAGASGGNGVGIVGANPNALIMPVTVMQSDGVGDIATIIKGVDYAVANGADIINMSFGAYANSSALYQSLAKAYSNCILVAASGNDGQPINFATYQMFPAAYTFVLGVQASSNKEGELAGFTNFDDDGPIYSCFGEEALYNYELTAPGVNIMSTFPEGIYRTLNGTSMASPLVAGAISRLIQTKEYDNKEILFGDLIHTSKGNVDIFKAYQITEADRMPTLDFISYSIDDSEGDNDGIPDAGEIICIYPTLRNEWGLAKNIKISLEMGDFEDSSLIEFIDSIADFGYNISGYGKACSANPLKFKISEFCADARHIKLNMKAKCDNITKEMAQKITLEVTNAETISGIIEKDTTLTADKVWLIEKNLAILKGVTFTIEPGTRVEFNGFVGIKCDGTFIAKGEPGKMIEFTNRRGQVYWYGFDINDFNNRTNICYTDSSEKIFSTSYSSKTPCKHIGRTIYINPKTAETSFGGSNLDDVTLSYYIDIDASPDLSFEQKDELYIGINNWRDTSKDLSYCLFNNLNYNSQGNSFISQNDLFCKNCIFNNSTIRYLSKVKGLKNCFYNSYCDFISTFSFNNYINLVIKDDEVNSYFNWGNMHNINVYNVTPYDIPRYGIAYIGNRSMDIQTVTNTRPSYLGTGREDLILPYCFDIRNDNSFTKLDLSNMLTRPVSEAHGIVWKVEVNGSDAQDEFEDLPPLGVGKQKFDVYFNRPMNKQRVPMVTMGVRPPYTQTTIAEEGSWNEDGTIYTAFLSISGKNVGDGLNRIYVSDSQDNEFFDIPIENTRFNVMVQAAGSMSTGFEAIAGLGRINLEWEAPTDEFEDLLGYNLYRYTVDENGVSSDSIKINTQLLGSTETSFVDYDVVPHETYYYYYKVMTTDLAETDPSKIVACTPLTSTLGDANGSGEVDVADVITTVNYASNMDPKPFIFEAADMNADNIIDIIDVVKIILQILHPETAGTTALAEATAVYTIEDDILYVESPVALGGIQVQLNSPEHNDPEVLESLKGFEHASAWLTDEDYLFLAYNMNGKTLPAGKHAILKLGEGGLRGLRLSDAYGHNIGLEPGNATSIIETSVSTKLNAKGIYNLNGQKVAGKAEDLKKLPRGIYIVDGQKVAK